MPEMQEIEYVLERQPGGGYLIYVPELPGLATEGSTREEAIAMLRDALPAYLQSQRERDQRRSWLRFFRIFLHSLHGNLTRIDARR
jgi:predicted RNase H-like HicB family nuclease